MAAGCGSGGAEDTTWSTTGSHGHYFVKKNFHKPSYCHHCSDLVWGLLGQGYVCEGKRARFLLTDFADFYARKSLRGQ